MLRLLICCLVILLTSCSESANYAPVSDVNSFERAMPTNQNRIPVFATAQWVWPSKGKVVDSFSTLNKGINIAGSSGEPIVATAAGKVVYSGEGLRGYGNLIIIKHNRIYLSAYAHNKRVNVKEGDWVRQGQKIAEMGSSGANRVMLHFEIRKAGKPINPMLLLKA